MPKAIDPTLKREAHEWIESMTGTTFDEDWETSLKSGVVLCELMNAISPGAIGKINKSKMAFMQMENIGAFIAAARKVDGMHDNDVFLTVDLYEGKDIAQVVQCVLALKMRTGHGFEKQTRETSSKAQVNYSAAAGGGDNDVRLNQTEKEAEHVRKDVKRVGPAMTAGHHAHVRAEVLPPCPVCNQHITSGVIHSQDRYYHVKCFNCKRCDKTLANKKYYIHADKHYCERCILIANPQNKAKGTVASTLAAEKGFAFA